jgi:hypothetical protein
VIDRYTKVVLTVIAGCLLVIVFRTTAPIGAATAQSGPVHVIVDRVEQFAFQFVDLKVHQ